MLARMRNLVASCLFAVVACSVHAEKAVIIGHGSTSCGDWLKVTSSKETIDMANHIGMSQWFMGFLSGVNSARIDQNRETYDLPAYNSIEAYVSKACSDNPLQNLFQVAIKLQLAIRQQEQSLGRGKN